jgi:hypothetical protein
VRKTQIQNTNVETLRTEQHRFLECWRGGGQPDAYDNTLINKTTELNPDLSGVLPCPPWRQKARWIYDKCIYT